MLIAIEGIDAAGKHTQAKMLADDLEAAVISFPAYGTPYGKLIAAHLQREWRVELHPLRERSPGLEKEAEPMDALVFQALQLANKMELAAEIAEKCLDNNNVVLDRYWPSAYAYGKADGLDPEWLIQTHSLLPCPDLFILLDVDVQHSMQRRPDRRDRYEMQAGFMGKVAENYRDLWRSRHALTSTSSWMMVDARGAKDDTHKQIVDVINAWSPA
jgi:thymidylate kinase